jgi:hypothetical protein
MNVHQQYAELIALAQLYLTQEYSPKEWIASEPATYQYFKQFAKHKKETPQTPVVSPPTSPKTFSSQPPAVPVKKPQEIQPRKGQIEPAIRTPDPKPAAEERKATPFALDPLGVPKEQDLSDIRKIVTELFPWQKIIDHPPSDSAAQQQAHVIVFHFDEPAEEATLLTNLSKAIQDRFGKTELLSAHKIDQENQWETLLQSASLRLILISEKGLRDLPNLLKHFQQEKNQLNHIPTCLMSQTSAYLQDPELKRTLWKTICKLLA